MSVAEYTERCPQCGTSRPRLIDTAWESENGYSEDYTCVECGYSWTVYFKIEKVVDEYGNRLDGGSDVVS